MAQSVHFFLLFWPDDKEQDLSISRYVFSLSIKNIFIEVGVVTHVFILFHSKWELVEHVKQLFALSIQVWQFESQVLYVFPNGGFNKK